MQRKYRKIWGFCPNPAVASEIALLDPKKDCQRIVHLLTAYEFGWDMTRSLEVALLYTFASDKVAKLLDRTGEFANHGQKRYDDTRLLIAHFMDSGWDTEIGQRALARMNRSHSHYSIANEEFLFVLWTFIHFPCWWMDNYARRAMTGHEKLAWFNFWVEIGERMGLKDIPVSMAEFDQWSSAYQKVHFVPTHEAFRVTRATHRIIRGWLPSIVGRWVEPVALSLLPDALYRKAVAAKPPAYGFSQAVHWALKASALVRRVVEFGQYPVTAEGSKNRCYPDNRYEISELAPSRLRDAENRPPRLADSNPSGRAIP